MAEHIATEAIVSGMKEDDVFCTGSHEEAAEIIHRIAGPGDIVLIKGSRAGKMEGVLKCFITFCIH